MPSGDIGLVTGAAHSLGIGSSHAPDFHHILPHSYRNIGG